nr:MAG TPA: hypothetical protein [Caudoviricetes sp.]
MNRSHRSALPLLRQRRAGRWDLPSAHSPGVFCFPEEISCC